MFAYPNDYVETGGFIYVRSSFEDAPISNSNNNTTVIGHLYSYFDYFDCHVTPVAEDPFGYFLDSFGSHFSSVQVDFESTTAAMDLLGDFLGSHVSPFSSVQDPSSSTIDFCLQYPRPSSICHTHTTALLFQIVDYYFTSISYYNT